MDYIGAVNRLLRLNGVIKGDDDNITTFSDTQHAAAISLAQIAIQDELADIVSHRLISYEKTSATIALVSGTRTYALATDFVRFYGERPFFYDSIDNRHIYEFNGGEDSLRHLINDYTTQSGYPNYWYWTDTTTKRVSFFQVPDSTVSGRSISYDYEKSVTVTNTTDTIPFHTNEEAYAFCQCAAQRFKFLFTTNPGSIEEDPTYLSAQVRLAALMNYKNPSNRYGSRYY